MANGRWQIAGSIVCDDLDLNAGPFRQGGDLDGGSRREVSGEVPRIDSFMPAKSARLVMKTVLLTTLAKVSFWSSRMALMFSQHAFGLRLDVAGDEVAGGRIKGDLAGAEKQVSHAHGVVVRPDGGGGFGGFDDGLLRHSYLRKVHKILCARSVPALVHGLLAGQQFPVGHDGVLQARRGRASSVRRESAAALGDDALAIAAFFIRFAMIISTVTCASSSFQQS